ncbi:hypothetical protein OAQ42_01850, partial [Flavobacteriaceae bacterium]|nr:hypothetical protein [Flavobacteriaceae bacterium]
MTASPSSGLQFNDVISLEDDASIFKFEMTHQQIPIYLFVRHFVLQAMVNKHFNLEDYSPKPKYRLKRLFLFFYYSIFRNLFFAPQKDIYIFSSEIVYKKNNSGKYDNSLYQNLFEAYPQKSCIITHSCFKEFFHPKSKKAYHRDLIYILAYFVGKFKRINKADQKTINNFIKYLKKTLTIKLNSADYEYIRMILQQNIKTTKTQMFLYTLFFKLKSPKMIIIEDAHYLNGSIQMLLAAKGLGIKTAEYQHGYISKAHRAYNFSEIAKKHVGNYLPEYFLTFGKYWSDMVNTPSEKIVIGKEFNHINQIKKKYDIKRVLFISSGAKSNDLVKIVLEFIAISGKDEYSVFIRPHPTEKPLIKERYGKLEKSKISIDNGTLTESLQSADFIVSIEPST